MNETCETLDCIQSLWGNEVSDRDLADFLDEAGVAQLRVQFRSFVHKALRGQFDGYHGEAGETAESQLYCETCESAIISPAQIADGFTEDLATMREAASDSALTKPEQHSLSSWLRRHSRSTCRVSARILRPPAERAEATEAD